jgi:hypothetical protein
MMRVFIFMSLIATAVLAAPLAIKDQAETPRLLSESGPLLTLLQTLMQMFAQILEFLSPLLQAFSFLFPGGSA